MKVVMMFTLALMALATVSAKNATLTAKETTVFFPQRSLPDFAFSKTGDMSQAYMVHNVVIKSGSTNVTLNTKMDHTGPDTRNVTTTDGAVVPSVTIGQSVTTSGVSVSIEGGLFPEWCSLEYGESAVNNPDPKNDPNISDIHIRNGTYKWTYTVKNMPKPAVTGNTTAQVTLTFTVTPPKEPSPSPSPPPVIASPSPAPAGNNTSPSPAPAGNNTASPSPAPAGNNTSPSPVPVSPTPVPSSPKPSPNATQTLSSSRRLLSLPADADEAASPNPAASPQPASNGTSPSPVVPSPAPAGNNTSPSPAPAGNNTASPSPAPAGNNTSPSPSKLPPVASPTPFPPVTPADDTVIDEVVLGLPKAALVDGKEVDATVVASQVGTSYQVTVTVPWGKNIVYDPTLRYKTTSPDVERVALLVIGDVGSFPFDDFINRLAHALELDQYDAAGRRARLMAVALTPSSSSSLSLLSAAAAAAAASPSPTAPSGQKYIKLASAKNTGAKNRLTIILDIYSAPHQSALESIERLNTLASSPAAKKNFGLQDMISVTDEPNPSPSPNPSPDKGGLKTWQWAAIIGGGAFVIAVLIGVCACRGKKEAKEEFHRIP